MFKNDNGIDLSEIEAAAQQASMEQIPTRPLAARIVASRPTDAEMATDFRERIYEGLAMVAQVKEEMKKDGFDVNFSWATDGFGRIVPGPIIIFKIIP